MEISFPPPAGAAPLTGPPAAIARTPAATPAQVSRTPANAPRALGAVGGASIARATQRQLERQPAGRRDSVVAAVLRAMREENEHLGILDGIDPLF